MSLLSLSWDVSETHKKKHGPFGETITDFDVFRERMRGENHVIFILSTTWGKSIVYLEYMSSSRGDLLWVVGDYEILKNPKVYDKEVGPVIHQIKKFLSYPLKSGEGSMSREHFKSAQLLGHLSDWVHE